MSASEETYGQLSGSNTCTNVAEWRSVTTPKVQLDIFIHNY